jgi:hypothetical protein
MAQSANRHDLARTDSIRDDSARTTLTGQPAARVRMCVLAPSGRLGFVETIAADTFREA